MDKNVRSVISHNLQTRKAIARELRAKLEQEYEQLVLMRDMNNAAGDSQTAMQFGLQAEKALLCLEYVTNECISDAN